MNQTWPYLVLSIFVAATAGALAWIVVRITDWTGGRKRDE